MKNFRKNYFYLEDHQILYINKPHIGTDNLVNIISNMRKYIESKGGIFLFEEKVTDIEVDNGKISSVLCSKKINTDTVILAIGHSARDTFQILHDQGVYMEKKPFAIGVRVEHKQAVIDENQFGELAGILPAADYKLTYQAENGRSIFSFCLCPHR